MIGYDLILRGAMMRANELSLEDIVKFSEGRVDLRGRRLIIHDLRALGQFRRDLIEMVGPQQTRRMLTRFGYFWGQADAAGMKRIFTWPNMEEWLRAGPVLHGLQGGAKAEVRRLEFDGTKERLTMEYVWHESAEADETLDEFGTQKEPSCWMQTGYASGYASYCLGKSVYFVEKDCKAKGDAFCSVLGKDIDSWEKEEIAPHFEYFHADDIQGKIRSLTKRLREKDDEIARQRKLLKKALEGPTLASVKVQNQRFQQILDIAKKVARSDATVLLTGETGVGKDVLARHIHNNSLCSKKPFVAINCAALTETLQESVLFGHRAGAFTGAHRDHRGLFEEADGGTIFLDEIGEISQDSQLRFLRVLQEREIRRVGESRFRKVNVRIIAATNQNLEQAVKQGRFREDLYYRIHVFHIEIPPLRERKEDILPLAREFLKNCASRLGLPELRLDTKAVDYLLEYEWPGNIRELLNAIEHAVILCSNNLILPEDLPSPLNRMVREPREIQAIGRPLEDIELEHIQRVLTSTNGNREQAAKILNIGQATLYRKLRILRQRGA